ncbi:MULTISPECIES: DUF3791 domain-containing protein [Holdemanella]|jgi:hypothetical protein|uniref:DUF3791 domain-containing protein n=1 Tax=Holdemanella biformis DSM 3989 TaxID=518637 RepID=B7CAA2_9FIRM|nr:DUF3791 domain-containing protein [Holdemanella biformis]EEC90318.1 hypothetical protein EUBIFOR_01123 [Holdemanella biformis DSM 3989]
MLEKKKLTFVVFILHALGQHWNMTTPEVYEILNTTGILDDYIIKCYDVLHTLGKEYLVEDITEFVREKGIDV